MKNLGVSLDLRGTPERILFHTGCLKGQGVPLHRNRAGHLSWRSVRGECDCALSGPVLRDTARLSQRYPLIARYGVFGVSTWPNACDTPSPFSERFPLGEHAKWRCDTPLPQRGISAILARYPMKTRQMGAIPPSAILSRKGIARYGGVSRTGPLRLCDFGALRAGGSVAWVSSTRGCEFV